MTWVKLPLRRLFRVVNGGTPTADEENWGGDIPWATPIDLGMSGNSIRCTQRTLTHKGVQSGSRAVPSGSLLLSTRAPVGYIARAEVEISFNQGCKALVKAEELDERFFMYQLLVMTDHLQSRSLGSTFLELSTETLAATQVVAPSLEEQRRIGDFLDIEMSRIGALVSVRNRMRELLELRRGRTIESMLGVANGVSESVSTAPLSYLARDVVVGIVVTPAAWYAEIGGVPALRGLNVRPGRIDTSDLVLISHEGDALHRKSRLRAGDVVVVRTGQAGAAAVVTDKYDGFNCIDLVIVRTGPKLAPNYLSYFLNSDHTRNRVSEYSVGSIQSHFNVGAMKRVPVPVIPVEEQEKVVKQLDEEIDRVDRLLGRLALQERVLVERRHALITAAVTGQIDVTTARGVE